MTDSKQPDSATWCLDACCLSGVKRLAQILALDLTSGDCVRLVGDLGAGKTTFATFLLQAYAGDLELTVPSPTFTLLERYDLPRGTIHHADLYRLNDPDEANELGLDEARDDGVLLIEWPDKAPNAAGREHLTVTLEIADDSDARTITITGTPTWAARLERLEKLAMFAGANAAKSASISYLQGDASARRYGRIHDGGGSVILMDSPAMPDGPPVKDGKPYSAIAHLAENVVPFVAVAKALGEAGIRVPTVRAADLADGFLIIDDLGDRVFGSEIAQGADIYGLYEKATGVLLHLRQYEAPEIIKLDDDTAHRMPEFDESALSIETQLLPDWYIPAATGVNAPEDAMAAFDTIWHDFYGEVRGHTHWVIRDFHSPNLIHLPEATGIASIGVIDFQDAMRGHAAYDVVALLQDARLDVPADVEGRLLERYCSQAAEMNGTEPFDPVAFRRAYAIFGAQRNTKILGIFARLARRDGKMQYLAHIPRIWGYLERNLMHPDLKPLKTWYDTHIPDEVRKRPLV